MPKVYSKEERSEIIEKLKEAANEYLMEYGVKKTTVNRLVAKAGIPKGTFYLFYPNKETLFFHVIMAYHNKIEAEFIEALQETTEETTIDEYVDLIMEFIQEAMKTCLMRMLLDNEIVELMNRLPENLLKEHSMQDHTLVEVVLKYLHPTKEVDLESFTGAFRIVFLSLAYQRGIGEEHFMDSIRMMLKGLLMQLK